MPEISVILPVYNAEAYLRQAIDSVLAQTFTDFELLIVDDGSTDRSAEIIRSYDDPRIRCLSNEGNKGLIYSLNRAIDEAKGRYLARMDADDICLPQRLEKQTHWLKHHPETTVVASFSIEVDAGGNQQGYFAPDRKVVTSEEIFARMPRQNYLTHPSVMGLTAIFKHYHYSFTQPNIEDYDLWLRMLADGNRIEKIPEPLILYRIHAASVTQTRLRKKNFFFKHFQCKRRFLAGRIRGGKFTSFDRKVALEMAFDLIKGVGKAIKQSLIK